MKTFIATLIVALAGAFAQSPPFDGQGRPNRQRPGPWDNDVLVYRAARNGAVEKLATFPRAGVPTAARQQDGRLVVAHQHFPADNDADFDKVAVHFSSDDGRTWSAAQVIRVDGLPEGMRFPFDPTLVPLPDGRVRLYFTGNYGRTFQNSTPAIHSAVAADGVNFSYEPGVRFKVEGRMVIDCAVVLHRGVFHLFAPDNGTGVPDGVWQSANQRPRDGTGYHATSKDGLSFTRQPDVQIEGRRRWLGNAQSDGDQICFFGTGDGDPNQPGGVWMATSADGQSWKLDSSFPMVPGADPGAVKLKDGNWLVVVTGPPRFRTPGTRGRQTQAAEDPLPPGSRESRRPDDATPRSFGGASGRFGPQFESVFVRIASPAAGSEGIAASLLIPRQPRFTNGAPVVINVTGGVQAGNARGRPEYVRHGFIEIHFAFPGGGEADERSGGTYDFRGPNCIRALADVIRFATDRIADKDGRFIGEWVRGVKVLTNNVGILGSSHGGNACGMAMALHGAEFPDLAWYASMESPYGEGAANVELGGHESGMNPAYDPKTGALALSRLAWSDTLAPGLMRKPMLVNTRDLKGALYFDLDGDGRFSAAEDFPANCFVGDAGNGVKAWYSPRLLAEAEKRKLIPAAQPRHVPTLAESREFWRYRDAAPSIPDAVRNCTNLAVIVYANERDHVQAAPDHAHILSQIEGFRLAKARFVRLNPDRAYVERIVTDGPMGNRPPGQRAANSSVPDNPAGRAYDRANITAALEPSAFPLGIYMQAAVCELADRTQANNWSANLDAVLYPDAPRSGIQPRFPPNP